jgi:hypothetical protein
LSSDWTLTLFGDIFLDEFLLEQKTTCLDRATNHDDNDDGDAKHDDGDDDDAEQYDDEHEDDSDDIAIISVIF